MTELLAFLSIERTMGQVTYSAVAKRLRPVEKHLHTAAMDGDHSAAYEALHGINLDPVKAEIEKRITALSKSAFMLGASLVLGGLDKTPTRVVKTLLDDDILESVVDVHSQIVTDRNAILIARYAAGVLADHAADQSEATFKSHRVRKAVNSALADQLNAAVDGTSKMMSSISANLSTSRLVSFGFLATAQATGVTKYQLHAILDDRTSEICQALDKRVFEVDKAYDYARRVLKTTNPEDLRSVAPFLKGTKSSISHLKSASDSELQSEGVMVPPFHPNCRTTLKILSSDDDVSVDDLDPDYDDDQSDTD